MTEGCRIKEEFSKLKEYEALRAGSDEELRDLSIFALARLSNDAEENCDQEFNERVWSVALDK
jgi:hypothetical protein